ncbi:MAG TPA: acyltransferase [Steroidobacteraceae bacterium]|nr:acyltransferase [Steroidobacteraceae bacterium]
MNEIRPLTGIRGIAALTVFLAHTHETLLPKGVDLSIPTLIERLFLSGGRQVDIFFVLSGFILTLIYSTWFDAGVSRNGYLKFMRKRLARIYPLQAFMLVLIAGFVIVASFSHAQVANGLERFSWSTLPLNFLLIHAWGFDKEGGTWNPPSWSISIEFLAYLLFPFFLWISTTARKKHRWLLLIAVLACGFSCNAVMFWGQAGISGISRGLTEFALGSLCVTFYSSSLADWLRSNLGSTLALLALLVCYALTPGTSFAIAVFAAPLILALTGKNPVSTFFGWAPVYFLGEISYSIYLGHFLFTSIAYRLVSMQWMRSGPLGTILGLIFIIAFVLGLSTLTYFAIERPGRDWLAGQRKGRPIKDFAQTNQRDVS